MRPLIDYNAKLPSPLMMINSKLKWTRFVKPPLVRSHTAATKRNPQGSQRDGMPPRNLALKGFFAHCPAVAYKNTMQFLLIALD